MAWSIDGSIQRNTDSSSLLIIELVVGEFGHVNIKLSAFLGALGYRLRILFIT